MKQQPHIVMLAVPVGLATLALMVAGCGGARSAGVASVGAATTTASANGQSGLVAFSSCMRSNGVPNMPDPLVISGRDLKLRVARIMASNPRFQTAQSTCQHLLPAGESPPQETLQQQRVKVADGLSFARCMRRRGVARFPDPTAQGQFTLEMVAAAGINPHSPAVLRVVQACIPASHGAITPAMVRQALNGSH